MTPPPPKPTPQKNFNFFLKKSLWNFVWLDTTILKIVVKSSQSLFSKTAWIFFSNSLALSFRIFFSKNAMKTWPGWPENLLQKNVHVALESRDYEASATIFGFPVSNHTKKFHRFKKISSKFGPIWRFFRFETTVKWL